MNILGTGLSGLVGSRIVELLQDKYEFENISRSEGVDITNKDQVVQKVSQSNSSIVLHLAAKTNVDSCEDDKKDGKDGEAWIVNVEGTRNIADACLRFGKKLIYVSTDFVFNGEKSSDDKYGEEDIPSPVSWYGQTKLEGENITQGLPQWIIARLAYPYRAKFVKDDFMRSIKNHLENHESISVVSDQIFCPTLIDDLAVCIDRLISNNSTGIFHTVGSQSLTPYDTALNISEVFSLDKSLIKRTTRDDYFKNRVSRPFNLSLKNDKIKQLGVRMKSFEEGIREVKRQFDLEQEKL